MSVFRWLALDLDRRDVFSDPTIRPPLIYVIGCPAMAGMVVGCFAGHEWSRVHLPWILQRRGQVIAFLVLAMMYAAWAAVLRASRAEWISVLREGSRARFQGSDLRRRLAAAGLILAMLFLVFTWDLPFGLLALLLMPAAYLSGWEWGIALKETTRLGLEARDAALRAKLAPHFIFNTLNTLHAQVENDPRAAQATTERLAMLFRQVLEAADRATIPLKQELAFIEAYLGIEQARLGERLRVAIRVPEELESAEVPPLSLQVLVENAVQHGVAPLERGGEITVGAERERDGLWVWVEDPGTGASLSKGTGTALGTLRLRLRRPEDFSMGMVEGRHRVAFRWAQA